ncbi:probable tRNA pseudouridine synthase 4 [Aspergillus udagawae]|uniref:tRNA pseudouridine(55) synthase n=1 Tax=Aspergillus udagawae TaxID=91492 RepID=A0ABQ1A167_9EURO|nr:probable tRNA pseudouridine synthase 4 [Aspergillus udagawae]GFF70957.1 probable tRNA pseudouridine synthase 4 [Aspergillus udagawae]GFG21442.1 probable tRNA pseudouridine synthase 4 [Aspergillus udagawae]GFG22178.1 probable tRNA pseudouridine synthase 4 [Aspergillus udagawae]
MSGEKIYEGVFAVHKPQGVTSADVIRTLQHHFNPSKLFKPWLDEERARRNRESSYQRNRRRSRRLDVKIGHGGTLDPLATGVLVTGVGKGTKNLNDFLGCTKTYETVVLFGAETDTYDKLGKIVRRAPYEHITREVVEKALEQFRGKIMQRPPIFSALKVQGKKLYEYAREGKEPPIEIQSRPVEVSDLRILEWYEPGTHEYEWPREEAAGEEKEVAERLLAKDDTLPVASSVETEVPAEDSGEKEASTATKRKTPPPAEEPTKDDVDAPSSTDAELAPTAAKKQKITANGDSAPAQAEPSSGSSGLATTPANEPSQPPAVKITMTVSSGFYVRSLAHDLGKALGSCGLMSSLIRTRQADFELESDKVLEYKDLEAGEDVWGPKVKRFLEEWEKKRAETNTE